MPYDLFDQPYDLNHGHITPPQFAYIREVMQREMAKVVHYYHTYHTYVKNEHILVKLLLGLSTSMRREPQDYVDAVSDNLARICSQFRISSGISYGKVYDVGTFYNKNIHEIYISDETYVNADEAIKDWRALRPIRVLRHPFTDLSMDRLTGKYEGTETGIAVISINIPMLALMYRQWFIEERKKSEYSPAFRTHHFVSMYPITNAMYSHVDICLFNRLAAHYDNEPVADYYPAHPFYITDMTRNLDDALLKELQLLQRRPLTFDQILTSVPTISAIDLRDAMQLPRGPQTRQVKWSLTIARLPLIRFLVQLNYDTQSAKNRTYLNRLKIQLRAIRIDRTLDTILPPIIHKDIDDMMLKDIEAYI